MRRVVWPTSSTPRSPTSMLADTAEITVHPAWQGRNVARWHEFVASDNLFGLDVETTAIGPLGAFAPGMVTRLIQIGNKTEAWCIEPTDPRWWPLFAELLADPGKRFVSHNAAFDATRVAELGIELGERSIDTLPMASLLHPQGIGLPSLSRGLKEICVKYIDRGLLDAEDELMALFRDQFMAQRPRKTRLLPASFVPGVSTCRRTKCDWTSTARSLCGLCEEHYMGTAPTKEAKEWGWNNIDVHDGTFLKYAGLDAVYVRVLVDLLGEKIVKAKMGTLSKREQRIKRACVEISRRGLVVDTDWASGPLVESSNLILAANARIAELTGVPSARSPKMKQWFLDAGIAVTSLDKVHVPDLVRDHGDKPLVGEVLRAIQDVGNNSNLVANLTTMVMQAGVTGGTCHPSFNTMQALTGRMSVTAPALQTLAKAGPKSVKLRGCLVARPGHVLVGADYDSQELRIAASMSGDPLMTEVITSGQSQHELTARRIFGSRYINKTESLEIYGYSKALNFAMGYGAGPAKIAAMVGCSKAEGREMWEGWQGAYATYVAWGQRLGQQSAIRNPFGRIIAVDPERRYAAGNLMIQSTGRDLLGVAMEWLLDNGWGQYLWMLVHDEIILEVPEHLAEEGCKALETAMFYQLGDMPMTASAGIVGSRWGGGK